MTLHEFYDYLVRARHDLWDVLATVPDEIASAPMAGGAWTCLKDLILHTAAVEDSWLHEDVQRTAPLLAAHETLRDVTKDSVRSVPIETLSAYWRSVETSTLACLADIGEGEVRRTMTPHDDPDTVLVVHDVLWHVMVHEVRHTAQIASFLRAEGIRPPSLDLLSYLPLRSTPA
jgi:uncharacterized damage-inducible protein DinB